MSDADNCSDFSDKSLSVVFSLSDYSEDSNDENLNAFFDYSEISEDGSDENINVFCSDEAIVGKYFVFLL